MAKNTFTGGARTKPAGSNTLHGGLKTKAPKAIDASYSHKGGSVSKDATRSATAPGPKTLGPRALG
jgi:hypothetical protein